MSGIPTKLLVILCFTTILTSGERLRRSDDISLETLHNLVQQQATTIQTMDATIQTLNTKLTASETEVNSLRSDVNQVKSKLALTSASVAFTVHFSANPVRNIGNHGIFRFDNVTTNIANGYDKLTGIFTAPASGTYIFSLQLMSVDDGPPVSAVIEKHGTILALVWAEGRTDNDDQGTTLVTAHMATEEQVWVRHNSGNQAVEGSWYTAFSGCLVQAD